MGAPGTVVSRASVGRCALRKGYSGYAATSPCESLTDWQHVTVCTFLCMLLHTPNYVSLFTETHLGYPNSMQ